MNRHRSTWILASASSVCALLASPTVYASDVDLPDGVYGRLRADTALSLEAGGGVAFLPTAVHPNVEVTARMRYLDMVGVLVSYDNAPGTSRFDALSLGIDLRPLMFARIFSDLERGPRFLDLFVDSIGLEMGAAWIRPGDPWGNGSGGAWLFGGGFELPLVWSNANALTLRISARWIHSVGWDPANAGVGPLAGEGVLLNLSLVARTMARLGLVGVH